MEDEDLLAARALARRKHQQPSDEADRTSNTDVARLHLAVAQIRLEQPGLVAKQVHALIVNKEGLADVTLSEVKKICSKLVKAEKLPVSILPQH